MTETQRKVFVLDTSVILYDREAIENFDEHDVAVPTTVLEELDQFKKGNGVMNLHAREFIREVDRLSSKADLLDWIPLNGPTRGRFRVIPDDREGEASRIFGARKNDHRILDAAAALAKAELPRRVILVTKDVNLRLKARAIHLEAEDYETVRVRDVDRLDKGRSELQIPDDATIDRFYEGEALDLARVGLSSLPNNQYVILRSPSKSALGYFSPRSRRIERVGSPTAYGISPRNAEQAFALHAVLEAEIPLVTIVGSAGTGKTLLALSGALAQKKRYRQIYLARPIVPLSNKDLGYLPGDVDSKISPYMEPLWDNLRFIKNQFNDNAKETKKLDDMVEQEKLHVVPLAYIRGRTFANVMFVVDEAQNLTPHEVKTIITRAGEGTKIVLTGDIFQIDTPYLDAHSNGLSYLIARLHDHPLHAHVQLEKGERSALANLASELL